eukprot:1684247-Lingulodinium_polyedra.AAC.1
MEVHIPGQLEAGACPAWLADVSRYRGAFEDAVLFFEAKGTGGGTTYLAFLYACQSPFYAMFQPLERLPKCLPSPTSSAAQLEAWSSDNYEYSFKKLPFYVSDQELPMDKPANPKVLPGCHFEGTKVLSDGIPAPWDKWVAAVSEGKPLKEAKQEPRAKDHKE